MSSSGDPIEQEEKPLRGSSKRFHGLLVLAAGALAEALATGRSRVRLAPIITAGPVDSVALLGSKKADLAVARADYSEMPRDAGAISSSLFGIYLSGKHPALETFRSRIRTKMRR